MAEAEAVSGAVGWVLAGIGGVVLIWIGIVRGTGRMKAEERKQIEQPLREQLIEIRAEVREYKDEHMKCEEERAELRGKVTFLEDRDKLRVTEIGTLRRKITILEQRVAGNSEEESGT